jgi:hypothetical protein
MCYKDGHLKRMDVFKNSSYVDHLGCVNAHQKQLTTLTPPVLKILLSFGSVKFLVLESLERNEDV